MLQQKDLVLKTAHKINSISGHQWDLCANPFQNSKDSKADFDPFISYDFLNALEESGSATRETGWLPHHLVVENYAGDLLGVMPMYLKSHSRGEYVFDFNWADAYERVGLRYYPKLQVAVPFTPVPGRRILIRPNSDKDKIEKLLLAGAIDFLEDSQISSMHLTFIDQSLWNKLGKRGFLQRIDQQFHWKNNNYSDFNDFLESLSSKKRRNISRERKLALQDNIEIEHLTGSNITENHWDLFFACYQDTGSRKWGNPYLTRKFFSLIGETLSDHILLMQVKQNGNYIASALNFIGGSKLYGRYWGCLEHRPFLHFEVCYYQAIEFAITNGLSTVEAGAQGEHKLARGYLPTQTYSAHWIADVTFREAVSNYLNSERGMIHKEMIFLNQHSPFQQLLSTTVELYSECSLVILWLSLESHRLPNNVFQDQQYS